MRTPKNTYLGKKQTNGIATSGGNHFVSVAQIFLECGGNKLGCHESISIIPKGCYGNETIDKISDQQAGRIFEREGWLVKGYNNTKYTRCPICRKYLKPQNTK